MSIMNSLVNDQKKPVEQKHLSKKRFGWQILIDVDNANFRTGVIVTDEPVTDKEIEEVIREFQRCHPYMQKCNVQALAFLGVSYFEGAYYESLDIEKFWYETHFDQLEYYYRAKEGENIG